MSILGSMQRQSKCTYFDSTMLHTVFFANIPSIMDWDTGADYLKYDAVCGGDYNMPPLNGTFRLVRHVMLRLSIWILFRFSNKNRNCCVSHTHTHVHTYTFIYRHICTCVSVVAIAFSTGSKWWLRKWAWRSMPPGGRFGTRYLDNRHLELQSLTRSITNQINRMIDHTPCPRLYSGDGHFIIRPFDLDELIQHWQCVENWKSLTFCSTRLKGTVTQSTLSVRYPLCEWSYWCVAMCYLALVRDTARYHMGDELCKGVLCDEYQVRKFSFSKIRRPRGKGTLRN